MTYSKLDDLEPENVWGKGTSRLEYVLGKLDEADELSRDLVWQSELWRGVTVKELLGALIEADWLLTTYEKEIGEISQLSSRFDPYEGQ